MNRQGRYLATALLAVALCATGWAQAQDATLRAGAAKRSIVPPNPTQMGGYFDRFDQFDGVASPIHARALVCANADTTVAVVSLDLLSVSGHLTEACRKAIRQQLRIPGEHVLVSAAHNHSGPWGYDKELTLGAPFVICRVDQPAPRTRIQHHYGSAGG